MLNMDMTKQLDLRFVRRHANGYSVVEVKLIASDSVGDLYQSIVRTPDNEFFVVNFGYDPILRESSVHGYASSYHAPEQVFPHEVTSTVYLPTAAEVLDDEPVCGDYPAPCNCDDPTTHNGH